ncbi:hypothetical protein SAMN04515675_0087 [Pseudomonas costantinii]|uniref:Uncharacterized protein n=1 Tax=Pseudomonas costantinii TaxID=168469 RepID=A0A1H4YGY5_9PSED|nr:hypothetical protein SAMN04515675_0087 [Pseudomonas costantinii]
MSRFAHFLGTLTAVVSFAASAAPSLQDINYSVTH